MRTTVTLERWGSSDLPLLERLMGDPRMTEHLGGPESPDKLRERQGRFGAGSPARADCGR